MNKALCICAAIALAMSSAAFARGGAHSKSQASTDASAQISAADCGTLSVDSARNACMRHVQGNAGMHHNAGVGATASEPGGSGMGQGTSASPSPTNDRPKVSN